MKKLAAYLGRPARSKFNKSVISMETMAPQNQKPESGHVLHVVTSTLARYFYPQTAQGKVIFVAFFGLISLLVSSLIAFLHPTGMANNGENFIEIVLLYVIFAPLAETLIFQLLPFALCQRFKLSTSWTFWAMVLPFAFAHLGHGIFAVIDTFLGGILLAVTFFLWQADKRWVASGMVFAVHAFHNGAAEILTSIFRD